MKRKLIGILTLVLVLSFGLVGFFSTVEARSKGRGNGKTQNCTYKDANNDGICDNCGSGFVDVNNDGICDNCGSNFVDADNDGICDNHYKISKNGGSGNSKGNGNSKNNGMGCGNGSGCGKNGRHHQ